MTKKNIFLIVVVLLLFAIWLISLRGLKIKNVIDGQTVELNNGAMVTLLGVDPTVESQNYLESLKGEKVKIISDNSQYFNVKRMSRGQKYPVYMLLRKGGSVNRQILINGLSRLNEAEPLKDSLNAFRTYASKAQQSPTPIPEPTIKPRVINYENDSIILPPAPLIQKGERKHDHWYTDGNENLEMLEDACDFNLPYTKTFANKLAAKSPGAYSFGQICEIFDYCYNKWSYVNDPADVEYVARASESIAASLTGDCDDFAVLMASCILAIGGRPCINTGYNDHGGHAFTEVDIAGFDEGEVLKEIRERFKAYDVSSLATRRDGNHVWLNLDWQARYPGGKYYDCSRSHDAYPYIDGRWTWEKLN